MITQIKTIFKNIFNCNINAKKVNELQNQINNYRHDIVVASQIVQSKNDYIKQLQNDVVIMNTKIALLELDKSILK